MSARTLLQGLTLAIVLSLSGGSALADDGSWGTGRTWIVDDVWFFGVDFTDIPPAVAAAADGDRILVRDGFYSGFTLSKGLQVIGGPGVVVLGEVRVRNLPVACRAAVSALEVEGLDIGLNFSTVIIEDLVVRRTAADLAGLAANVRVVDCADVRFRRCTVGGHTMLSPGFAGMEIVRSRAEIVDSLVTGEHGVSGTQQGRDGSPGLHVLGSEVHVSRSTFLGGDGGRGMQGGDGACGIELGFGSGLQVSGTALDVVVGGNAGLGDSCAEDGAAAPGLRIDAAAIGRVSGVGIKAGSNHGCGLPIPPIEALGVLDEPATPDPTLILLGTPVAGQVATFVVTGPPGANLRINLGRRPILHDLGGIVEDRLLKPIQMVSLGPIPDTGEARYQVLLVDGAVIVTGDLLIAQAALTMTDETRVTQSAPLLVR